MAITTGILFCTLLLGALALPKPSKDEDMSKYFETESVETDIRIIGGSEAGVHPWLVAITFGGHLRNHYCGGSILNRRTILTAAHCVHDMSTGNMPLNTVRVNAGTNRYRTGGQSLAVRGYAIHPLYVPVVPPRNDVATLYLANLVNLNAIVQRVSISWDFVGGGVYCYIAGWGSTVTLNSPAPDTLKELATVTITGDQCNDAFRYTFNYVVDHIEICTYNPVNRGICTGDSGGPLIRSDTHQQIALASWVVGCGAGYPDVFARISAFRDWIQENTQAE